MASRLRAASLFDPGILAAAARDAFVKLDPRHLVRNPVIFVTEVVAAVVTAIFLRELLTGSGDPAFSGQIAAWLWFTVLFANFAEAVAEGRGKAQAAALRGMRSDVIAKRLAVPGVVDDAYQRVPAEELDVGDIVLVEAGDLIPADGEVIEGIAMVNELAVTGESAPVIREAGGDRSAVTGGTKVVSDRIKVKVTVGVGLDLPRPHDRAGGRRRAAANAERAGAVDPAVRHDADLSDRGRDAVGPRRLFGHRTVDHGADRAAW